MERNNHFLYIRETHLRKSTCFKITSLPGMIRNKRAPTQGTKLIVFYPLHLEEEVENFTQRNGGCKVWVRTSTHSGDNSKFRKEQAIRVPMQKCF